MHITRDFVDPLPRRADKTLGLGGHLRAMRQAAELTQGELAQRIGVTRTSITNIELGTQSVSMHNLDAIARALGYEVTLRFKRTGSP